MKWSSIKPNKHERNKRQKALVQSALDSQKALEKAAASTMDMAQDVTTILQARIDDYASQIDSTARLLSDALLLVDETGLIKSFNPAAEKIFGWTKRDIVGQPLVKLFKFGTSEPNIDLEFMNNFCDEVNDDVITTSATHHEAFMGICKDGQLIYVDVSASKLVRSDKKTLFLILVRDVTQRVKNDEMVKALALRNEELIVTVNSSDTGMVILEPKNKEFTTVFVNKGFENMTGRSRKELLDMKILDLLAEDGSQFTVRRCLADEETCRHEVKLVTSSGDEVFCDVSITPVFKDRKLRQWILVFYDTSELKKAYEELSKSEQHFRAFGEASSEALLVHGANRILDWNPRLVEMTGYTDEEISKMTPLDLVHPLERNTIRDIIATNDVSQYETLVLAKNGDVFWVAVNAQPVEWSNLPARIGVMRDVTPYKDIEGQLRAARERYRGVVDNTIDLVCCFDSNFRITFSNQTFRDYFDFEMEDLSGFSLLDVIPDDDHLKFVDYMQSITPDVQVRRGVHRVKRGREMRWQDWIDRGIFDDTGNLIEYQSVCRDVTHLMPPADKI